MSLSHITIFFNHYFPPSITDGKADCGLSWMSGKDFSPREWSVPSKLDILWLSFTNKIIHEIYRRDQMFSSTMIVVFSCADYLLLLCCGQDLTSAVTSAVLSFRLFSTRIPVHLEIIGKLIWFCCISGAGNRFLFVPSKNVKETALCCCSSFDDKASGNLEKTLWYPGPPQRMAPSEKIYMTASAAVEIFLLWKAERHKEL